MSLPGSCGLLLHGHEVPRLPSGDLTLATPAYDWTSGDRWSRAPCLSLPLTMTPRHTRDGGPARLNYSAVLSARRYVTLAAGNAPANVSRVRSVWRPHILDNT